MEETTELFLRGTAIEELPHSICNLPGLQILDLVECKHLKRLPFSVLKLPKLLILWVELCRKFRYFCKCEGEEGEGVSSVVSSEMKFLGFSKCNLSDDCLSMCLSCFPNLICLDLSFNSFTTLPACIKECHLLRDLSVEQCKQLRIIEGMPPNLETFKAKNCSSLTSLSSSTLLNQAFHKPGSRQFILPGQNVPEWFHHWNDGESMRFWVRKEFPAIVLCVVVGVLDKKDCTFNLKLSVRINGIDHEFDSNHGLMSTLMIDHIFLCDLERRLPKGELQKLLLKDQWNLVEVLCMNDSWIRLKGGVIKWIGGHIYQQGNNMENILFLKCSSPKRTCHDLDNSNCDLELGWYPTMKKQHVSQDMGVCDRECETMTKHKGKDYDSSEWLSMHPCWQEPTDKVNWDTNSMKSASTSDPISEQGSHFDVLPSMPNCNATGASKKLDSTSTHDPSDSLKKAKTFVGVSPTSSSNKSSQGQRLSAAGTSFQQLTCHSSHLLKKSKAASEGGKPRLMIIENDNASFQCDNLSAVGSGNAVADITPYDHSADSPAGPHISNTSPSKDSFEALDDISSLDVQEDVALDTTLAAPLPSSIPLPLQSSTPGIQATSSTSMELAIVPGSPSILDMPALRAAIAKELERLVLDNHLAMPNVPILTEFFLKYPAVRLSGAGFSNKYKGYAYNCLSDLLHFLRSCNLWEASSERRAEWDVLVADVRGFAFDNSWLDAIESRILSANGDSPRDALQSFLDSKQRAIQEVNILHSKIGSLTSRLEVLKSQIPSAEAVLHDLLLQEPSVRARASFDAPLGF